jgi:hypothetical protein
MIPDWLQMAIFEGLTVVVRLPEFLAVEQQ